MKIVYSDRALMGQLSSMARDLKNMHGESKVKAASYLLECAEEAKKRKLIEDSHYKKVVAHANKLISEAGKSPDEVLQEEKDAKNIDENKEDNAGE